MDPHSMFMKHKQTDPFFPVSYVDQVDNPIPVLPALPV